MTAVVETRRVSVRQMELLVEFLEGHRSLALGWHRSKEGRALNKRLWNECAITLNSIGDGAYKNAGDWSRYWSDIKNRIKTKLRTAANSRTRTGGGPPTTVAFTPIEERIVRILGQDVTTPLVDVPTTAAIVDYAPLVHVGEESLDISTVETVSDQLIAVDPEQAAIVIRDNGNMSQLSEPPTEPALERDVNQPSTSQSTIRMSERSPEEQTRWRGIRRPRTRPSTSALGSVQQKLANVESIKAKTYKLFARALTRQAVALSEQARALNRIADAMDRFTSTEVTSRNLSQQNQ